MTPVALAPFDLSSPGIAGALGFLFGFVLERSGFGDARRLAAQFYFTEVRVLKVMFTAIVTCLLLLTAASSLGFLDFGALQVNETWLPTALLGGLLLGVGFVVGGYCPGTSLVSAATGKIDGMFFVLGVSAGVFAFGETAGLYRTFYDTAGALGRITLPDVLGLPFGVTVALVVAMAALMFGGATWAERRVASRSGSPAGAAPPARRGARVALALGLPLLLFALVAFARPATGGGSAAERVHLLRPDHDRTLATREVHLDPVEVLGLLHREIGGKVARFRLAILDVREESDYNLFHLAGAERTTPEELAGPGGKAWAAPGHQATIVVLVGNGERRAEEGWRLLKAQGVRNAYVLAGGVNLWLDVFRDGRSDAAATGPQEERLRHAVPASLGERHPWARPPEPVYRGLVKGGRTYPAKVKPVVRTSRGTGGCG